VAFINEDVLEEPEISSAGLSIASTTEIYS
jgi:hypothetical protein